MPGRLRAGGGPEIALEINVNAAKSGYWLSLTWYTESIDHEITMVRRAALSAVLVLLSNVQSSLQQTTGQGSCPCINALPALSAAGLYNVANCAGRDALWTQPDGGNSPAYCYPSNYGSSECKAWDNINVRARVVGQLE